MTLTYFDLITPEPLIIPGVGSLKPPLLREISRLSYPVYETYLAFLSMSPERYCTEVNTRFRDWFGSLTEEQTALLTMYDVAVSSKEMTQLFTCILQFFFKEQITYDSNQDCFLLRSEGNNIPGKITKNIYQNIVPLILELNHIKTAEKIDLSKVKNEKGRKVYEKIQRLKAEHSKCSKKNTDLDIGNIISAVCTRHHSINYTNVWELTVYQLWDTFHRLQAENAYAISRTMVSVWGDKDKKFDFNSWFKNITKQSNG